LHYREWGRGEPLILLHGLGSGIDDWSPQIETWSQQWRVIALDLRGHGGSEAPAAAYDLAASARDVMCLADHLGLKSFSLVVFSMGGMVALEAAVHHAERLRCLVLVNTGPESPPGKWQFWYRKFLIRCLGLERLGRRIALNLFPRDEQAPLRDQFVARMAGNDPDAYVAAMAAMMNWSVVQQLCQLNMPVLVVTGDRDYTPVDYKRWYCELIPDARLVEIVRSGHATPIDQPAQFNAVVGDFLMFCHSDAHLELSEQHLTSSSIS
jgi:pimeloyl-ACP methyl ester carboxylesterase